MPCVWPGPLLDGRLLSGSKGIIMDPATACYPIILKIEPVKTQRLLNCHGTMLINWRVVCVIIPLQPSLWNPSALTVGALNPSQVIWKKHANYATGSVPCLFSMRLLPGSERDWVEYKKTRLLHPISACLAKA